MRLSNKSTFSLVCLILLMAFVAVPVMAHAPDDTTVGPHTHPVKELIPEVPAVGETAAVPSVPAHNHHPVVTSIALKADAAKVRDNMVVVGAAADSPSTTHATVDPNEFILIVTFDRPVVADETDTDQEETGDSPADITDADALAILALGDITRGVRDKMDALLGTQTNISFQSVAWSGTDYDAFEVKVRAEGDAIPTGMEADATETVKLGVSIAGGVVHSPQMSEPSTTDPTADVTYVGGDNLASSIYNFVLVKELPTVTPPDTTAPSFTVVMSPADMSELEAGATVQFTLTASEALGTGNNELLATDVVGTTNVASQSFVKVTNTQYVVIVTPTDHTQPIVLTIAADSVFDTATTPNGNAERVITFTPADDSAPTVVISSAMGTGDNAGKIVFTFTFSEPVTGFTADDLIRSAGVTLAGAVVKDSTDEKVYTVVVNPSTSGDTTLTLKTGSVTDGANSIVGDQPHTYEAPTAATIPTAALGNSTAGGTLTVTFSKDPGTVATTATGYTISTAAGTTRTITVPATQGAGSHSIALTWDNGGSGTVTYTIPAIDANTSPDITIGAGEFVVVVRDTSGALAGRLNNRFGADNITLVPWMAMPDLQNIFETGVPLTGPAHGGGALILRQSGDSSATGYVALNPGTVGISEIMWAIDLSQLNNATARSADQWIELHNLNTTAATVKLSWKTGAKDIAADSSINGNLDRPYLDVVTNVFHDRAGNRNGPWVLPGSNGNPLAGVNFVSAARKGTFSLTNKHDNKFNKRYTRSDKQENATNSPDGRNKDQWEASTVRYDLRSETITLADGRIINVAYEDYGTPGRPNNFSPERADVQDARTNINPNGIIINEIANRDDEHNQYEWIELRNVSDAEINLNNYLISMLTGVGQDRHFIILPNNNNAKIPAGGVLLLVDSDPFGDDDHPLVVGWNVDKNPEDQVPGLASLGISATSKHGRYKVVQFGGHGGNFTSGLPNDGNFILVVRRPDNHEGDHGHGGKGRADLPSDRNSGDRDLDKIVDIAGYVGGLNTGLGYKNAVSQTSLWPLKSQGAPDDKNRLSVNKVRQRQHVSTRDGRAGTGNTHNDRKAGQIAFGDVGYSGVGYKRQAANSAIHGGTPGYDNGAQKGKVLDLAMDKLVISELMLSQGPENARTTLPQWIEIHNPSPHPVHLGGWRLIIENPRDPIRTINLGSGSVKTILSEQTILVISGSARDIGSDTLPSSTVFPETRVYNVYKHQRNEFDMDSRFDPILNEEAFRITLIDGTALDTSKADQQPDVAGGVHLRVSGKYYAISDVAGNLDGDPRTNDTPEDNGNEAFKKGMTEDGNRTSLIRIFDDGAARDGTGAVKPLGGTAGVGVARMKGVDSKYSWVHAADAGHRFVRHTWYGDETDWGTPNNRAGQVLPVSLSHFRPTLEDGKVVVRWTTESELDNAGFNILRSDSRNGEFAQVNDKLIQGKGTTGERSTYKWVDATAKPGVVYYYQIEDVSFAGERQTLRTTKLKGYISAENKLTTTWGDLKEVQ